MDIHNARPVARLMGAHRLVYCVANDLKSVDDCLEDNILYTVHVGYKFQSERDVHPPAPGPPPTGLYLRVRLCQITACFRHGWDRQKITQ